MSLDSFRCRAQMHHQGRAYNYFSLRTLGNDHDLSRLNAVEKILLENLLRHEDGENITHSDIMAMVAKGTSRENEIAFYPARVLMQDFTGVPAIVDLACMREAVVSLGGDANSINPMSPVDMVIDHSINVDHYGSLNAAQLNASLEYQRNRERYQFIRWGQDTFRNFTVVPPATGIVHQVNLEYLAQVVIANPDSHLIYPDTVIGTDSHTTMINGLGVLGWGVGGIEAEAAMLGQSVPMRSPEVVGFRLDERLHPGVTATDLVLTVVQMLRQKGVVGKFVEFHGKGLDHLSLADRATIANMSPEFGATSSLFSIDQKTLDFLAISGRREEHVRLVEEYSKEQGLYRSTESSASYDDHLSLDLSTVQPSIAGPSRPQDRIELRDAKTTISEALAKAKADETKEGSANGETPVSDGDIVIASITSCTNTSNPQVMIGAGLLAAKAVQRGLQVKPWVKTSLAPGSQVVRAYLEKAGLLEALQELGFAIVGYGCTTCIGNSGPLDQKISEAIQQNHLTVCSVLSGNRNFEGRIHADVRMNFLASPPLVVAYAIAGNMTKDLVQEPLGMDSSGNPVYLQEIWPSSEEIEAAIATSITRDLFLEEYRNVFTGNSQWNDIVFEPNTIFSWNADSTYIRKPTYFQGMKAEPPGLSDIHEAQVIALLGDSITTDHISPAGAITKDSPAGRYLQENNVAVRDYNSYGSRRGNHEVMVRGTFANTRLRNQLAPGTEGGWTRGRNGSLQTIYDAAMEYQQSNTPLMVIAGKEYGTGSSRDWAAKGPQLLGVKVVLVESFERIHRSNLLGMGILPLQFLASENAASLGLTGEESYSIKGIREGIKTVQVEAKKSDGQITTFTTTVRIDTTKEWLYYRHGGILQYVIRQQLAA